MRGARHGSFRMTQRGPPCRRLRGVLLAATLLGLWPRPAHAPTSVGISNLGSRLCKVNPFVVWANETGEGSAGALMVWLLATRDILPYCDLHLVAPEGAGVIMHFLSANLRKTPRWRSLRHKAPVIPPGIAGCVDTVTVEHVPSEEAPSAPNNSNEEAQGTTLVETTCVEKKLTASYHHSPYEATHALTRIRLVIGDRDEKSIVGYQLMFNIYLHGNWSTCPHGDQFQCKDENCIWNKLICDGAMNCPDMSDEYEATHANCITGTGAQNSNSNAWREEKKEMRLHPEAPPYAHLALLIAAVSLDCVCTLLFHRS